MQGSPASPFAGQAKLAVTVLSISLAKVEPWKYAMEGTFLFFLPSKKKSYYLPPNMKRRV